MFGVLLNFLVYVCMHVLMCFVSVAGGVLVCLYLIVIFTSYITVWFASSFSPSI